MNRREALRQLSTAAVGAAASPLWVTSLTALAKQQVHTHAAAPAMAAKTWTPRVFSARQNDQVISLTELIIPATETPGAKAALVNRFIDQVLADAPAAERNAFLQGLSWIGKRSVAEFGKDFSAASQEQQTALLTRLAGDERPAADATGIAFFRAIKSMTISGYYSTEIGLRQELGDDGQMVLAEFHGCDHPEHQQ
jgi:glucoside 3-dehydrogenase (cytochrome c) hitch-hiker subunit